MPLAGSLIALTVAVGMAPARAAGPREGNWDTTWRDGGARLSPWQSNDQVGGSYEPHDDAIDARADGGTIRGKWRDSGGRGRFEFKLAPDGATFLGRFDNGEWWTGRRAAQEASAAPQVDLFSPRAALRTFAEAGNRHRSGDFPAIDVALQATDFSSADGVAGERDRIERGDRPVPRHQPNDLPHLADAGCQCGARARRAAMPSGHRCGDRPRDAARRCRRLAAHGYPGAADEDRYDTSSSPRATMQAFLVGMHAWGDGGVELALRILDLSEIPPRIRDLDAPLLAD